MPDRAVVDDDRHFHWSNAVAEMTPQEQADWIASVAGDDDEAVIARMKAAHPRAVVEERWKQASKNYFFHPTEENREARDAAEREWRAQPAVVTLSLSWRAVSYLERTVEADIEASKRWLREHGQAHKLERPIFAQEVLEVIQRQLEERDA